MTFSELLIKFRADHSLSQRRLAELCNVSNGYISMLENNVNPSTGKPVAPTLPALRKIARGMGMSLDDLLALVDDDAIISLKKDPAPEYEEYAADEIKLIDDYRQLSSQGKEYIRQTMVMAVQTYAGKNHALSDLEDAK